MTTLDVLRTSRQLISDPAHWCKGSMACNELGAVVNETDPTAYCWCASGAIWKVARTVDLATSALHALLEFLPTGTTLTSFNDRGTHVQVLSLFDQVIARLSTIIAEAGGLTDAV